MQIVTIVISAFIVLGAMPRSNHFEVGSRYRLKVWARSYRDEYRDRVLAMIDEKVNGQEITVPREAPAPRRVIDLMAALEESMRTAERGKKRNKERKRKKA
jgi:non-homologous end joining protein Ku